MDEARGHPQTHLLPPPCLNSHSRVPTRPQPKTYFLRPDIATSLGIAIVREFFAQKIFGKPDRYQLQA